MPKIAKKRANITLRNLVYKFLKFFKKNSLIIFVVLIAFSLRVLGIYPGYPDNHPDEGTSYNSAIYMLSHYFYPGRFDYPAGMPLLHAFFYMSFFLPFYFQYSIFYLPSIILAFIHSDPIFFTKYSDVIFGRNNIYALYWSRCVSATIGTATVALVYLCGKQIFNKKVGIFAAFFLAFNFRHIVGSHFGMPDVLNSFFFLLSLYFSYNLFKNPNKKNYIVAGIIGGIGLSLKYQPFGYLPFLAAHILLTFQKKSILYIFNISFIKGIIVSVATFLFINPYYIFNIQEAMRQNRHDYLIYQMGQFHFRPYGYIYLFHWGIGELVSVSILLGIILMIFLSFKKSFLLLSFIVPVMFVMTIYSNGGMYPRNFTSVIPYLMIFAGFFMEKIYQIIKKLPLASLTIIVLLLVINFVSIRDSFMLNYYYSKPWNSGILTNWTNTFLPSNTTICRYPLDLTIDDVGRYLQNAKEKNIKQLDWNYLKGPNSLAEFQEEGADFAILNLQAFQSIIYQWRQWGAKNFMRYNGVPFEYLTNGFYGLSIAELMNYTVKEIYHPWQAYATNYLVFKIPQKPKDFGSKILEFNFENKNDTWQVRGVLNMLPAKVGYESNVGIEGGGALTMLGEGEGDTTRLGSSVIPVIPGKFYAATGLIRNIVSSPIKDTNVDRDGFLRIDFYSEKDNLDRLGMKVAISGRSSMSGAWASQSVYVQAPAEARYMTLSFQRKSQLKTFTSYLSNVKVYISDKIFEEEFKNVPYIRSTIPKESIYYNSFF